MYIAIRLEFKDTNGESFIERIFKEGNVSYLVKDEEDADFPYLAEVESYDYSVFDSSDMDGVIKELIQVREILDKPDDQQHIDDIIRLAKKCKEMPNTVLVFAG